MTRPLKARLADNELTIGSWITLAHPSIAEILSRAGFDWLVIDTEHSVLSDADVQALIRAIEPSGCAPLVRVASNDATRIKRVMDAGAHGVMVPMVTTREQAEAAVSAVHYPPTGTRGVGLARAQGYGASFADYRDRLADEAVVIVMIEHVDAVTDIDDILTVPGVDGFIIGPYDLSASIGKPGELDDAEVTRLIDVAREAGERHGRPGGLHVVEPDVERFTRCVEDGFRFVGYSLDIRILDVFSRQAMQTLAPLRDLKRR